MSVKKGKMTAVVAVRAGSQRIKNKNIRPFSDTNLLELKLQLLIKVKNIDEIIVNSDSDAMLKIAEKYNVKAQKREAYFASSEATNSDFHKHIGEVTSSDFIFLAPVCSPFISVKRHEEAIDLFLNSDCDSLTSCELVKGHLWLDGKPINYSLENVPNSQDLPDIKKLNYGISIIEKKSMIKRKSVVGLNPKFIVIDEIESTDIDDPVTFKTAEVLYENLNLNLL
jgi:CMP-N,N'-diacetyllegionaminic acid synthase